MAPLTDKIYEELFPGTPWRKPLDVTTTSGAHGFACRFCLARNGLRALDVGNLPQTIEEFNKHMEENHPNDQTPGNRQ